MVEIWASNLSNISLSNPTTPIYALHITGIHCFPCCMEIFVTGMLHRGDGKYFRHWHIQTPLLFSIVMEELLIMVEKGKNNILRSPQYMLWEDEVWRQVNNTWHKWLEKLNVKIKWYECSCGNGQIASKLLNLITLLWRKLKTYFCSKFHQMEKSEKKLQR
jgi:hypothetical protein